MPLSENLLLKRVADQWGRQPGGKSPAFCMPLWCGVCMPVVGVGAVVPAQSMIYLPTYHLQPVGKGEADTPPPHLPTTTHLTLLPVFLLWETRHARARSREAQTPTYFPRMKKSAAASCSTYLPYICSGAFKKLPPLSLHIHTISPSSQT